MLKIAQTICELEETVKGPGVRIDLDVRRIWKCPRCGRVARTAGHTVAQRCGCAEEGIWMQLQPPVKREAYCPPPRVRIPEEEPEVAPPPVTAELSPETVIVESVAVEVESVVVEETSPDVVAEPAAPLESESPETEVFGEGIVPRPEAP